MEPARAIERYDARIQTLFFNLCEKHKAPSVVKDIFDKCLFATAQDQQLSANLDKKTLKMFKKIRANDAFATHVKEVINQLLVVVIEESRPKLPVVEEIELIAINGRLPESVEDNKDKESKLLAQRLTEELEFEAKRERQQFLEDDRKLAEHYAQIEQARENYRYYTPPERFNQEKSANPYLAGAFICIIS